MKYSVFTPCHRPEYLASAYMSLKRQTDVDWEWVVLLNGDAVDAEVDNRDERVKVHRHTDENRNIGALKRAAASLCEGEWLVELDHDDELLPTCLEEIGRCDADFVYSNQVMVDDNRSPVFFTEEYGWQHRDVMVDDRVMYEILQPELFPSHLMQGWFSPWHVRAWRREFYRRIGGHDPSLFGADDHDLLIRTYLNGTMHHIDKPLYLYVSHAEGAGHLYGGIIDECMWKNNDRYYVSLYAEWARKNDLRCIDLASYDLSQALPLADQSVAYVKAHDILHFAPSKIGIMNECYRVLAHGGMLDIRVPSTKGEGAFAHPRTRSYWNRRSLDYYDHGDLRAYIEPECYCRFQSIRTFEDEFDGVPTVFSQMIAVHDGPRIHGLLFI